MRGSKDGEVSFVAVEDEPLPPPRRAAKLHHEVRLALFRYVPPHARGVSRGSLVARRRPSRQDLEAQRALYAARLNGCARLRRADRIQVLGDNLFRFGVVGGSDSQKGSKQQANYGQVWHRECPPGYSHTKRGRAAFMRRP